MKDRIAWNLLSSLNKSERKRYAGYLSWKMQDKAPILLPLVQIWWQALDHSSEETLTEADIWAKALPKEEMPDPKTFKKLLFSLSESVKDFLLHDRLVEGNKDAQDPLLPIERSLNLLYEYLERDLEKHFESLRKKIRKSLADLPERGEDYYRLLYRLNYTEDAFNNRTASPKKEICFENMPQSLEALRADYLYHSLRQYLVVINASALGYSVPDFPKVDPLLKLAADYDPEQSPSLYLLRWLISLYLSKAQDLEEVLHLFETYFSSEDKMEVFTFHDRNLYLTALINLARKFGGHGHPVYRRISHFINQLAFKNGTLFANGGRVAPAVYRNVILTALYQKDFAFAEEFMEEMKNRIAKDSSRKGKKRDPAERLYQLCLLHFLFHKGEYTKSKTQLGKLSQEGSFISPTYNLDRHRLEIKLDIVEGDFPHAFGMVDTIRSYINNNRAFFDSGSDLLLIMERNFDRLLRKLETGDAAALKEWQAEIAAEPWFPEKEWMLEYQP